MIEIKQGEIKELTLSIKTTVADPEQMGSAADDVLDMLKRVVDGERVSDEEIDRLIDDEETVEMELCTEAVASVNREGNVEISYWENEDDEALKTLSKIIFNPCDPDLVVMTKEGAMSAILSFEEGKTHVCTYKTPFMPIKVYVTASLVDNRLLCDGYLGLNYVLVLNDTPPQRFSVKVAAKEAPKDDIGNMISNVII